jgi:hypothetical protein
VNHTKSILGQISPVSLEAVTGDKLLSAKLVAAQRAFLLSQIRGNTFSIVGIQPNTLGDEGRRRCINPSSLGLHRRPDLAQPCGPVWRSINLSRSCSILFFSIRFHRVDSIIYGLCLRGLMYQFNVRIPMSP